MTRTDRAVIGVVGAVVTLYAAYIALLGLYYGISTCGDACSETSPDWWDHKGAWQWSAQTLLAVMTFAFVLAAWVLMSQDKRRQAAVAGIASLPCVAGSLAIVHEAGIGLY